MMGIFQPDLTPELCKDWYRTGYVEGRTEAIHSHPRLHGLLYGWGKSAVGGVGPHVRDVAAINEHSENVRSI
jgi:hypothetical protein